MAVTSDYFQEVKIKFIQVKILKMKSNLKEILTCNRFIITSVLFFGFIIVLTRIDYIIHTSLYDYAGVWLWVGNPLLWWIRFISSTSGSNNLYHQWQYFLLYSCWSLCENIYTICLLLLNMEQRRIHQRWLVVDDWLPWMVWTMVHDTSTNPQFWITDTYVCSLCIL